MPGVSRSPLSHWCVKLPTPTCTVSHAGRMSRFPSAMKRRPSLDFASGYGKALDEYGSDLDLVRLRFAHAHVFAIPPTDDERRNLASV